MESFTVAIVGAGPAGLALALSLAKFNIHSVILEKEDGITQDPRGVFLAGDAVRIVHGLGVDLDEIGHKVEEVKFHNTSFQNRTFCSFDLRKDTIHQAVPQGLLQNQPKLEAALRRCVSESPFCHLKESCEVTGRTETPNGIRVEYKDSKTGITSEISADWLIGADGKRGVVRKYFLEPTAGIRQETGLFAYEGTWIAANIKITPPTPQTHPDFPLWSLGYTPSDVYDLFWPKDWHFCSPPGEPTACGRFGPNADMMWRHEIAVENWDDSMDAEKVLLGNLLPMLERTNDENGKPFPCGPVKFPQECMDFWRCRPFTFAQKVVNKWFHNRTILIGDAAHVFPPFGGQGIACGVRDAHGLAWRLALLTRLPAQPVSQSLVDRTLTTWALERRQGVDDSARLTKQNGELCNDEQTLKSIICFAALDILRHLPIPSSDELFLPPMLADDRSGYQPTKSGFHLHKYRGGGKLAQVFMRSKDRKSLYSDEMLRGEGGDSIFSVLTLGPYDEQQASKIQDLVLASNIPSTVLSKAAICHIDTSVDSEPNAAALKVAPQATEYQVLGDNNVDETLAKVLPGYDTREYSHRFACAKFAIVRPDSIVFAMADSLAELEERLHDLHSRLY